MAFGAIGKKRTQVAAPTTDVLAPAEDVLDLDTAFLAIEPDAESSDPAPVAISGDEVEVVVAVVQAVAHIPARCAVKCAAVGAADYLALGVS
jgi:hypothetical protein